MVPEEKTEEIEDKIKEAIENKLIYASSASDLYGNLSKEELTELLESRSVIMQLDISLLSEGVLVEEFNGVYTVKIQLTDDLRGIDDPKIVFVDENDNIEVFDTEIDENYITFRTTHFSNYCVLGDKENNSWIWILVIAIVAALAIAATTVIIVKKKKGAKKKAA